MPNWVTNKVKFSNRGKEILDKVITKVDSYDDNILFDFNKIIPRPKELDLMCGGNQKISIQYALSLKSDDERKMIEQQLKAKGHKTFSENYWNKFVEYFDETKNEELIKYAKQFEQDIKNNKLKDFEDIDYKGLGIKTLEDLGNRYIQNIIEYGYDTWYDWSCANWGTKWNSSHLYIQDDNNVEFDTAWSCPFDIFEELSKQYPDIEIYVEYADEDLGSNCGYFTLKGGETIDKCSMDGDIEFAMEVLEYDDEMREEIRGGNRNE